MAATVPQRKNHKQAPRGKVSARSADAAPKAHPVGNHGENIGRVNP